MEIYYGFYSIALFALIWIGLKGIQNSVDWNTTITRENNRVLQEIRNELKKKK